MIAFHKRILRFQDCLKILLACALACIFFVAAKDIITEGKDEEAAKPRIEESKNEEAATPPDVEEGTKT